MLLFPCKGLLFLTALTFLLAPVASADENEEEATETASISVQSTPGLIDFTNTDQLKWESPLDPFSSTLMPGPIQWSYFHQNLMRGPHEFSIDGGAFSRPETMAVGDPMMMGNFRTSFTYRYHGLFGGVIRPVTRFTIGTAQSFGPAGGTQFQGFSDAWMGYAMQEAGVEIVYRGVGVGMTAGYVWTMPLDGHNEDVTGPYVPEMNPRGFNWDDLWKNIYLILE